MTLDTGRNTVGKTYGWEAPPGADPLNHFVEGAAIHGGNFEMPIITHVKDNLWHGGYVDNLDLGDTFPYVISMYKWEKYPTNGLTYAFEMYDGGSVDQETLFDAVERTEACLDTGENVLVHCQAGLNRSSLVVATVLIRQGMEPAEAIRFLREKRSEMVLCNHTFERYLLGR